MSNYFMQINENKSQNLNFTQLFCAYFIAKTFQKLQIAKMDNKNNKSGFIFVFLTVALDMLSIGIIIPIMPHLVAKLAGGNIANAALVTGWFATGWAIAQFFSSPVLGSLSDHYGRKPIFLISNFGQGIAFLIGALAPNIWVLLFSRILSGIVSGSVSTAYAYIADTEEPSKRAAKFGILGAAFGLGFVLGPAIGGIMGAQNVQIPLYFAAIVSFISFAFGLTFLKESLPLDKRTNFSWRKANPIASFNFFKSKPEVIALAGVKYLNDIAHVALPATFVLYANYRFGWTQKEAGLLMMFVGIAGVIVQGGLIKQIIKAFGEKYALYFGLLCGSFGFFGYAIADTGTKVYFAIAFAALWGVYGASIQAFLSSKVSPTEQGRLQGALGSMTATAGIIGPPLFSHIFEYFITDGEKYHIPGAAMLLSSILIMIALICAYFITRNEPTRIQH
jgi:MFS transporter, DHA1 family, tetracycline resistance protein